MQLGIRIKASEEYADVQALHFVNADYNGLGTMFIFSNPAQKRSYDEVRRRIKGGESLESIAKSYQQA